MTLSIIIPSYNYAVKLDIALKYLAMEMARNADEIEVIVVDDGSADNTQEILESWRATLPLVPVRHETNQGLARSRNDGAKAAHGRRILFMDSDIVMSPGVLGRHLAFHAGSTDRDVLISNISNFRPERFEEHREAMRAAAVFPATLFEENVANTIDPFFDIRDTMLNVRNYRDQTGFWLFGSMFCASMSRSLWEKAGGFDENFRGWGPEDIEFSYRVHHQGGIFHYAPDALCYHLDNEKKNRAKLFADVQRNVKHFFAKFPNSDIKNYLRFAKGDICFEEYICQLKGEEFRPGDHPEPNFLGIVKYLSEKST